jgi:hypothetical protein
MSLTNSWYWKEFSLPTFCGVLVFTVLSVWWQIYDRYGVASNPGDNFRLNIRLEMEGYSANRSGVPANGNPYTGNVTMSREWLKGWVAGNLEDR